MVGLSAWLRSARDKEQISAVTRALIPNTVKTCKDCRWLEANSTLKGTEAIFFGACRRPGLLITQQISDDDKKRWLVLGEKMPLPKPIYKERHAQNERIDSREEACGEAARFWEARP